MSRRADAQLLVIAKAPVPGQVKTRLCPPCTPAQAAQLAAAALADTLAAVRACTVARRVLALDGDPALVDVAGLVVRPQRGVGLGARLVHAFADAMAGGHRHRPTLVVGMDTPQLTADLLDTALDRLDEIGTVLGPAADGGWWALGVTDPDVPGVLGDIPMSRADTGARTAAALSAKNIRWGALSELLDVDTIEDARAVARLVPDSRFARTLDELRLPSAVALR